MSVAIANPFDLHAIDAIHAAVGGRVIATVAHPSELGKLIKSYLGVGAETIDGLLAQQEDLGPVEMLEDMVQGAMNEASKRVDEESQEKMRGMLGGMGLPPGMF